MFSAGAPFLPPHLKKATYSSYAQSYASQQAPSHSGDTASIAGGIAPSIVSTQYHRLERRTSAGSLAAASDAPEYKTTMQDDSSTSYTATNYAQSQAGYTDY